MQFETKDPLIFSVSLCPSPKSQKKKKANKGRTWKKKGGRNKNSSTFAKVPSTP
jgi:hypothetical protein